MPLSFQFQISVHIRTYLASIAVNECRRFHARFKKHQMKRDETDIDSISLERAGAPDRQTEGVFAL